MTDNNSSWVTDKAWITGLIGSVTVLIIAFSFQAGNAVNQGAYFAGMKLSNPGTDTILLALTLTAVAMCISEVIRLYLREKSSFISIHPLIQEKKYSAFFQSCLVGYIEALVILWLVTVFFETAGEYGFRRNAPFYQPWFRLLDLAWIVLLWAGMPYLLITRALKHTDKISSVSLHEIIFHFAMQLLKIKVKSEAESLAFKQAAGKAGRDLLVKMIFAPLITVFFVTQFGSLVNHIDYIFNGLAQALENNTYSHKRFNDDLANISITFILTIDFALAWCGYLITSRWLNNHFNSSDPKLRGWIVCMLSFPPFKLATGWFFTEPNQLSFLNLHNQEFVTILVFILVGFLALSTVATIFFGIRFSNMTNRGIIRTGPFAWVRHPAYAAKNIAWWITGIPFIFYQWDRIGLGGALSLVAGLGIITWIYYWRAITEEEHLSNDPRYLDYCQQTRYRFIPGVI